MHIPTKAQVKLLAEQYKAKHGCKLGHAYHAVSRQLGFKDWNVLSAVIKQSGTYVYRGGVGPCTSLVVNGPTDTKVCNTGV